MMSELVTDSQRGDIAVLCLNSPEKINAISLEMRAALAVALSRRFLDDRCRAIVLAGAGGNFSAGADIKGERPPAELVARSLRQKISKLQDVVRLIATGPKPVVAAVEGKAFGAGLSLALACDG